jgi:hypothetical protein
MVIGVSEHEDFLMDLLSVSPGETTINLKFLVSILAVLPEYINRLV